MPRRKTGCCARCEMENLWKRTDREIADLRLYSLISFARDLLVVADNMRRAPDAVALSCGRAREGGVKAVIEGVELTERELLKALEKNGVRQFTLKAKNSIPTFTRRCSRFRTRQYPSAVSCRWWSRGYTIGDRVLRPALVGVSKGGPNGSCGAE